MIKRPYADFHQMYEKTIMNDRWEILSTFIALGWGGDWEGKNKKRG